MPSIALGRGDVIVGVDTHKNEHVAVALDGLGGHLGDLSLMANPDGYANLVAWACGLGTVSQFGVEGTGESAWVSRRRSHHSNPWKGWSHGSKESVHKAVSA